MPVCASANRRLIGRRFEYDGRENIVLSDSQRSARDAVLAQLETGALARVEVSCPSCQSQRHWTISEKDMYGLPMTTVLCRDCALVYSSPRMTNEGLAAFYDGEYRRLDRRTPLAQKEFFALEQRKGERIIAYLHEHAALDRTTLVVEIGCGAGGILDVFRASGFEVLGVDLGSEYIEYGSRTHGLNLHVGDVVTAGRLATARGLGIGLVLYEQVLEHVPDPAAELRRARMLIDENGLLFVGVPGLRDIARHYNSNVLHYLQLPHLVHFELATLQRIARRSGFRMVHGDEQIMALFQAAPEDSFDPISAPRASVVFWRLRSLEWRYLTRRARAWGVEVLHWLWRRARMSG